MVQKNVPTLDASVLTEIVALLWRKMKFDCEHQIAAFRIFEISL